MFTPLAYLVVTPNASRLLGGRPAWTQRHDCAGHTHWARRPEFRPRPGGRIRRTLQVPTAWPAFLRTRPRGDLNKEYPAGRMLDGRSALQVVMWEATASERRRLRPDAGIFFTARTPKQRTEAPGIPHHEAMHRGCSPSSCLFIINKDSGITGQPRVERL